MKHSEWLEGLPDSITDDPLWRMEAYRLSLFAAELAWYDASKLMKDKRTVSLSDQLYRAVGSISANIAEGYSMGTGRNRARFYEYALGSGRESRDWYQKSRHILGESVVQHRQQLLSSVIRLLLKSIPQQRTQKQIREETTEYVVDQSTNLFQNIPYSDTP